MSEALTCASCNATLSENECNHFDGDVFCDNCFFEGTFVCSCCGERFWSDVNNGNRDTPLCELCYDYNYTRCDRCNCIIHNDDQCFEEEDEDSNYPFCYDCYHSISAKRFLHAYSYKPAPVFHGDGERYFGVELEIDNGGRLSDHAQTLTELANQDDNNIYIKTDGSLNDGLEIVTHPMTLDYHINKMPWLKLVNTALSLGYRSHKTNTCGLHFHVNRTSFTDDVKKQDECIGRVLFIVERFWQELLLFSRRTEAQVSQWAARYGYKDKPAEILDHSCYESR